MTQERNIIGNKYDRNLSMKDVAKGIRQDLKEAGFNTKNGYKISITINWSSMSCLITCDIKDMPVNPYSEQGLTLIQQINTIHQAYNRDQSDMQTDYFDVNYYGHVSIDYDLRKKWELIKAQA